MIHRMTMALPAWCLFISASSAVAQPVVYEGTEGVGKGKHVVFLAGDHEYRSEETLPALARILAKHHGFKCTVLFNVDAKTGEIVPGNSNMPGMEALGTADLAVVFLRFQNFPQEQMKHLDTYLNRGGPVVGLRTATHAFKIKATDPFAKYSYDSKAADYSLGFGHQVLGQTWVGHYGTNHKQSTRITVIDDKKAHPILRGVTDVWVQAGGYVGKPSDGEVLTMAQPLNGMKPDSPVDASKPPMPSEWTRSYKAANGKTGRVFTTLYGTPEDLLNDGYRRMLVNGCLWALGLEETIKPDANIGFVGPFKPTTFGNGSFAKGVKPAMYADMASPIPADVKKEAKPATPKAEPKPAAAPAKPAEPKKPNDPTLAEVPADYRDPLPFAFKKDDVVAILGNGLSDRFQHDGWMETLLQSQLLDQNVRFRNMSTSGDRPNKYPRSPGQISMTEYLRKVKPSLVFAFFGYNESFDAKPDEYKQQLIQFVKTTRAAKPNGVAFPRIVLFSPIAFENTRNPNLPDGKAYNARLSAYTRATEAAAKEAGVAFVDLFQPSLELYRNAKQPLTLNGVHLSEEGNRQLAPVIAKALLGKDVEAATALEPLRQAVLDKDLHWWNRYRASDGNDIWGSRAGLKFVNGQSNADVLQPELVMLDVMTANRDERVWAVAAGKDKKVDDGNVPKPVPVISNVGGGSKSSSAMKEGTLKYLSAEESLKQIAVAKGFKVGVFADEKRFPQLIKPVQLQFDTKGRLWAAVWPTYPKWEPLKAMNDGLVILHDDDNDGVADRCTEFAKVQNPLGFEFWNGGVLVTCQSELLFLKDTDGDDKADVRIVMLQGLDSSDTHHGANNLIYGPDGGIYWQSGVFMQHNHEHPWGPSLQSGASAMYRFDPRRFTISMHAGNSPNPHGTSFDYWGYQYATDGTGGRAFQVRPEGNGFKMHELLKKEVRPVTASEVVSSTHFPESMQGDFLICNVIGFLGIKHYHLTRNPETGAVWGEPAGDELVVTRENPDGTKVQDKSRGFLMSGDKNFRPSDAIFAPDGSLYFGDWQNVIIGHMQHNVRDPNRDHVHGRIYRVTAIDRPLQKPVAIFGQPIPALLDNLKHPVDGIRHRTRIELSGRDSKDVIAATKEWIKQFDPKKKEDAHHLLEALWLHQQHNVKNEELLKLVLESPEPHARIAAKTVQHFWMNVEKTLRGGVIADTAIVNNQKSGIISDTPQLTTIRIATVPEKMMYDVKELTVKPGKKVKLTFANFDFMPHNMLLVKPGKADEVGLKAIDLGAKGFDLGFIPESKDILWHSKLVEFGQEQVIEFTAPMEEGAYTYVCTFPGHHRMMRGTLFVTDNLKEFLIKNPRKEIKVTEWKLADLAEDTKRVAQHRNFAEGKQLFLSLGCVQCHRMNKDSEISGRPVGPDIDETVKKYKRDPKVLLQEMLEPSKTIEDKFRQVTFELDDGNSRTGVVVEEDATSVTIMTGSPAKELKISKKTIDSRRASQVSIMPSGLLNTLDKEQILDLLAYMLANGSATDPAFKHGHGH
jgi:putative membrane-bound dehydrogenase-like protein